jgi:hypothetical protein
VLSVNILNTVFLNPHNNISNYQISVNSISSNKSCYLNEHVYGQDILNMVKLNLFNTFWYVIFIAKIVTEKKKNFTERRNLVYQFQWSSMMMMMMTIMMMFIKMKMIMIIYSNEDHSQRN